MLFTVRSTRRRLVEARRREEDVVRRPSQRFAIQNGVLLVPQSGGNAAQEQQLGTPHIRMKCRPILTLTPRFPVHRRRKNRCGGTVKIVSKNHIHIGRILRVVPRADGSSANQRTEAPKEFRSSHRVPFPSGIFSAPESAGEGASRTVCRQHLCPVPQSDRTPSKWQQRCKRVFPKKGRHKSRSFF